MPLTPPRIDPFLIRPGSDRPDFVAESKLIWALGRIEDRTALHNLGVSRDLSSRPLGRELK